MILPDNRGKFVEMEEEKQKRELMEEAEKEL